MSDYLTTTQAGRLLGLSSESVRTLCDSGKLPCMRPGVRQRRILRTDVERYRDQRTDRVTALSVSQTTELVALPKPSLRHDHDQSTIRRVKSLAKQLLAGQRPEGD